MDKIYATSNMAEISPQCEKISIDCAVKKPASEDNFVYTHPTGFGWSDLGNHVRCMISYKKMIITTELLVISNYMNVTTV